MLVFQLVQFSKNPVQTGEAFLLQVTVVEVIAYWNDTSVKKWNDVQGLNWTNFELKYF